MASFGGAQEILGEIADAFVGFLTDLYAPSPNGSLPLTAALQKDNRYLYLSLLVILVLMLTQLLGKA